MNHRCLASGCKTNVSDRWIMCARCWFLVSQALKDKIWREYFYGVRHKKHPTDEYTAAVHDAIVEVDKAKRTARAA